MTENKEFIEIEISNDTSLKRKRSESIYEDKSQNIINNINESVTKKLNDQDLNQRINVILSFFMELYRVLTSSLLILFIPQNCGHHVCSLSENLTWNTPFYNTTLILNFITLFYFFILYIVEIIRENRMIKYMDVNTSLPNDDEDVANILTQLPTDKKNKILNIDKIYQIMSYIAFGIFIINSALSGIVSIGYFYLDNQTISTFITYILFMITKLLNIYTVANTSENVFYSAYLKTYVQFNDIDKSLKKIDIIIL